MPRIPASVLTEWRSRIVAEHMSGLITRALHGWLVQLDVAAPLVAACERIVDDEKTHSRMSAEVYAELGGDVDSVSLAKKPVLALVPRGAPTHRKALVVGASVFCCGESAAVPLFLAMRRNASRASAVTVLQRILRDEGRHRAFGWKLITSLLTAYPDERGWLRPKIPYFIDGVVAAYSGPSRRLTKTERAWGLLEPQRYGEIVRRTRDDVLVPRFRRMGLY